MIDYSSINDVANVICDLYFKNEKISEKKIYGARESFKTRHNIVGRTQTILVHWSQTMTTIVVDRTHCTEID